MKILAESSSRRLFFAIWPPIAVANQILERADALDLEGRAVMRDALHLTLAFHGRCDAHQYKRLIAAANTISEADFELSLDKLGYFRRPRIVWLGASTVPAVLMRIADQLAVTRHDRRAFVPHVSVLRNADPVAAVAIDPITWRVREFALIESGGDGTPGAYQTLARWALNRKDGRRADMK